MSDVLTDAREPPRRRGTQLLTIQIGWRNLWRNTRRTWLTAGGIAFAILLVVFSMALQFGSYAGMIGNATSLLSGHMQIQSPAYADEHRVENTIDNATSLRRKIESTPGVKAVAPRVEAFVLALDADGERSSGVQIIGADIEAELRTVNLLRQMKEGRVPQAADEAVIGTKLARNLDLRVGGEIVLLGSAKHGGVAALALKVVGLFESGMAELDRSLIFAQLEAVQSAFDLGDEVHTFAIQTESLEVLDETVSTLRETIGREDVLVRHWEEVLPELQQAIELDRVSGQFLYWIIMILVAFSVVNSFIMTVFERTREFGMLIALGSRPMSIVTLVLWEALFMWVLGAAIGLSLATVLVGWLSQVGIDLGQSMEELAATFYVSSRMYPEFSFDAMFMAPAVMLVGTLLGALIPSLRIPFLKPVEALRAE